MSESNRQLLDRIANSIQPDDPSLATWFSTYRKEHIRRLAEDLDIVAREVVAEGRILEYGAIPLVVTAALAARNYRIRAVDIAPERFQGAIERLGLDVRACNVETERVPFPDNSFDAVLFNEIFEHLRIDPIFTLEEVHRVLTPGGHLLLSTPNLRSFRGIRNLVFRNLGHASSGDVYEQYAKISRLGHMGHVREYTTREVSEFLARVGFRPERIIFRGGHGRGLVGVAEQMAPSLRPFFSVIATTLEAR